MIFVTGCFSSLIKDFWQTHGCIPFKYDCFTILHLQEATRTFFSNNKRLGFDSSWKTCCSLVFTLWLIHEIQDLSLVKLLHGLWHATFVYFEYLYKWNRLEWLSNYAESNRHKCFLQLNVHVRSRVCFP